MTGICGLEYQSKTQNYFLEKSQPNKDISVPKTEK